MLKNTPTPYETTELFESLYSPLDLPAKTYAPNFVIPLGIDETAMFEFAQTRVLPFEIVM